MNMENGEFIRRGLKAQITHPQIAQKYTGYKPSLFVLRKAYADAGHQWIESRNNLCSDIINHFFNKNRYADINSIIEGIKCFKFAIENGYPYHYNSSLDRNRKYYKVYTVDLFEDFAYILMTLFNYYNRKDMKTCQLLKDFMEYYFSVSGGAYVCDNTLITYILDQTIFMYPEYFDSLSQRNITTFKYYLNTFIDIGFSFDYIYYDVMLTQCNPEYPNIYTNAFQFGIDCGFKMNSAHMNVLRFSYIPFTNSAIYGTMYSTYLLAKTIEMKNNCNIKYNDEYEDIEMRQFLSMFSEHVLQAQYKRAGIDGIKRLVIDYVKRIKLIDHSLKISTSSIDVAKEFKNHSRMTKLMIKNDTKEVKTEFYSMLISMSLINIDIKICYENEYLYKYLPAMMIINYKDWKNYRVQTITACQIKLNVILRNIELMTCNKMIVNNTFELFDSIITYC